MAITSTLFHLMRTLNVEPGSSLLEIGEANWYGDLDPETVGLTKKGSLFEIAKDMYQQWFAPSRSVAIDCNGTPGALRHDLNYPINLAEQFDVVINHGTAEHVFNIGQVFKTMHDHCDTHGWMIHDAPFFGWVDHGFYCIQPTMFYDLAAANRYEVQMVAIHEPRSSTIIRLDSRDHVSTLVEEQAIPQNALLCAILRKVVNHPFVFPTQGYYARTLTQKGARAWETLR